VHTGFWWGNPRETDHWEDLSLDWGIILNGFLRSVMGGMDWTNLADESDRWQALVSAAMNLQVP